MDNCIRGGVWFLALFLNIARPELDRVELKSWPILVIPILAITWSIRTATTNYQSFNLNLKIIKQLFYVVYNHFNMVWKQNVMKNVHVESKSNHPVPSVAISCCCVVRLPSLYTCRASGDQTSLPEDSGDTEVVQDVICTSNTCPFPL